MAVRGLSDTIQRAKTAAMADNRTASMVIDTAGKRLGLVVYNDAGAIVRTDFVPLPDGIRFEVPTGNTAPVAAARPRRRVIPSPGTLQCIQQDFNSRVSVVPSPATSEWLRPMAGPSARSMSALEAT